MECNKKKIKNEEKTIVFWIDVVVDDWDKCGNYKLLYVDPTMEDHPISIWNIESNKKQSIKVEFIAQISPDVSLTNLNMKFIIISDDPHNVIKSDQRNAIESDPIKIDIASLTAIDRKLRITAESGFNKIKLVYEKKGLEEYLRNPDHKAKKNRKNKKKKSKITLMSENKELGMVIEDINLEKQETEVVIHDNKEISDHINLNTVKEEIIHTDHKNIILNLTKDDQIINLDDRIKELNQKFSQSEKKINRLNKEMANVKKLLAPLSARRFLEKFVSYLGDKDLNISGRIPSYANDLCCIFQNNVVDNGIWFNENLFVKFQGFLNEKLTLSNSVNEMSIKMNGMTKLYSTLSTIIHEVDSLDTVYVDNNILCDYEILCIMSEYMNEDKLKIEIIN